MKLLRELLALAEAGFPIPLTVTSLTGQWPGPDGKRKHSKLFQTQINPKTGKFKMPSRAKSKRLYNISADQTGAVKESVGEFTDGLRDVLGDLLHNDDASDAMGLGSDVVYSYDRPDYYIKVETSGDKYKVHVKIEGTGVDDLRPKDVGGFHSPDQDTVVSAEATYEVNIRELHAALLKAQQYAIEHSDVDDDNPASYLDVEMLELFHRTSFEPLETLGDVNDRFLEEDDKEDDFEPHTFKVKDDVEELSIYSGPDGDEAHEMHAGDEGEALHTVDRHGEKHVVVRVNGKEHEIYYEDFIDCTEEV